MTNWVTIGSIFRWCIPDLVASRRSTVVISAGRGSRNRDQADDRDAKPATRVHPATSRNQQVKALTLMRAGLRRRRSCG